jgi:hypothetical protein
VASLINTTNYKLWNITNLPYNKTWSVIFSVVGVQFAHSSGQWEASQIAEEIYQAVLSNRKPEHADKVNSTHVSHYREK